MYTWVAFVAATLGCSCDESSKQPTFQIPEAGIALPALPGWVVDASIGPSDPKSGGVVFRLTRESPVPLSPRIDVLVQPQGLQATRLEEFFTENLRDMAAHEKDGSLRIASVEQRPITIGPRRGFRVKHDYTLTTNPTSNPIAVTQISTLLVIDGRGVAVVAAGRTELFHPLAESIEALMNGIVVPVPVGGPAKTTATPIAPTSTREAPSAPSAEPVDLGKIGGK
ncbi:MAG: hypothetical protein A2289_11955 [Deltaproteobacteria bacterium RIFOXYA12_FULL_58_15]|nr:MAG: hypothetical protein A2289_11955 [Deltaproteobacteria bacterium RIFOXYA12_FULL_58_15]OGR07895.1 MAG: hypothetical protein A2341_19495 [Deltaproteobacteria bacterium RIFOXYB12_FULL_58_9]